MDNRENNINDNNAKAIKNNLKPRGISSIAQKIDFSALKGNRFPLFERTSDYYIYEKKFYNDLPKDLVFPKAFNLNSNVNNFAKFDMMTMLFGLKKSQDLLTNPRLNTNIHQDFISNSLQLIFPEKKIDFLKSKNLNNNNSNIITNQAGNMEHKENEAKRLEKIKSDILSIIEAKDESENKEKLVDPKTENAFYLRNTMLLSSYLNINKNVSRSGENILTQNVNENADKNKLNKTQHEEYIKTLDKTFEESDKIKEGMLHPRKKGIYAKKVYSIFPFFEFDENKFSQIIFPDNPENDNCNINNNLEAEKQDIEKIKTEADREKADIIINPQKFLLRKNVANTETANLTNQIFSFYKQEAEDEEELNTLKSEFGHYDLLKRKINYFNYIRDYSASTVDKTEEIFNRYLIFLNKNDNTAKILPIFNKIFLKKHKKNEWANNNISINNINGIQENNENEDENFIQNKAMLNRKRDRNHRDIELIPKNLENEDVNNRNISLKNSGFLKQFSAKAEKIQNIKIERKLREREDSNEYNINNQENNYEAKEEEEEDDLFGNAFNEHPNEEEDDDRDMEFSNKDYEEDDHNNYASSSS